jgi:hypothetical protein
LLLVRCIFSHVKSCHLNSYNAVIFALDSSLDWHTFDIRSSVNHSSLSVGLSGASNFI